MIINTAITVKQAIKSLKLFRDTIEGFEYITDEDLEALAPDYAKYFEFKLAHETLSQLPTVDEILDRCWNEYHSHRDALYTIGISRGITEFVVYLRLM